MNSLVVAKPRNQQYIICNDIAYNILTPLGVIEVINEYMDKKEKLRFIFGDEDGVWDKELFGTLERSGGTKLRTPLVRAMPDKPAEAMLTDYIIKIKKGNKTLYRNPLFK